MAYASTTVHQSSARDAERAQGSVALTEAEIDRFARVARETHGDFGDEMAAIILFAAYTGVRPGELSALRWTDLDPANRQAVMSLALDGQSREKTPKN